MAKRRNMGGRPAKNATVTPMKLSKENREIAKIIGDGNMTYGVEKALKFYAIYHDSLIKLDEKVKAIKSVLENTLQ